MVAKPPERVLVRRLLKPAWLLFVFLQILIGGSVLPLTTIAAHAQQTLQRTLKPSAQDELLTSFYKDPRPERLVGFFDQFDADHPAKWDAYPAVAGFFAVVFREYPASIERLMPARLNPQSATTLAAALRMSGNQAMAAKLKPKFDQAGQDEKLTGEFGNLPARIEDLSIRSPTHLDILWGAAFASGDERYVRMIIAFFAQVANRSEQMTADIAKVVIGMAGGPKDIFGELKNRYGVNTGLVIVAAAALWAAESNARQHAFVEQTVNAYIRENPGTYATRAMSALRPKSKAQ
jgi:hypothetical protein